MDNFDHLDNDYEFCTEAINFNSQCNITLEDGKTIHVLGKNYCESHWYTIYQFVEAIGSAADFKIKCIINSNGKSLPDNDITAYYEQLVGLSRSHDPDLSYGPHVQLFYHLAMDVDLNSEITIEKFKKLVEEIRLGTQSKEFKKKARRKYERLKANEKTAIGYINKIFDNHARLMILRLDLHLKISSKNKIHQLDEVRKLFAKFLNDRRSNKFFDHELGYLWKLEDGQSRGGHYHLILILDGSKVQKDEFIASQIGEFWKKITDGDGTYFNANSKKYLDGFASKGIGIGVGRIESHDTEKRAILIRIVKYLFKVEQYVEAKLSPGMRSFGKGTIKQRSGQGGRPRKVKQ